MIKVSELLIVVMCVSCHNILHAALKRFDAIISAFFRLAHLNIVVDKSFFIDTNHTF